MFRGSIVALITPFRNGGIDEAALQALVEWHIEQGTHGLVPVGTTGKSPTLSHAEHERVVELVIEAAAGRVPVIAGAGSNSTAEAISLARHAQARRRRCHPGGHPLLQQADPGRPLCPLQGDPRRRRPAADHLQHPRALGGRHERRDHGGARPAAERGRGQGCDLRPRAPAADHARLRRGVLPAVGRGHHRALVPRPWRRRLHLGDRERRAAPVRRDARGLAARRCQGGARDPPAPDPAAPGAVPRDQPGAGEVRGRPPRQVRARRAPAAGRAARHRPRRRSTPPWSRPA